MPDSSSTSPSLPKKEFEDTTLTCRDCTYKFDFTARDQTYFAEKGWAQPKRCKDCRRKRRELSGRPQAQEGLQ